MSVYNLNKYKMEQLLSSIAETLGTCPIAITHIISSSYLKGYNDNINGHIGTKQVMVELFNDTDPDRLED